MINILNKEKTVPGNHIYMPEDWMELVQKKRQHHLNNVMGEVPGGRPLHLGRILPPHLYNSHFAIIPLKLKDLRDLPRTVPPIHHDF